MHNLYDGEDNTLLNEPKTFWKLDGKLNLAQRDNSFNANVNRI